MTRTSLAMIAGVLHLAWGVVPLHHLDPNGAYLFYDFALGASASRGLRVVGGLEDICPPGRGGVLVGLDGFSVSILAQGVRCFTA